MALYRTRMPHPVASSLLALCSLSLAAGCACSPACAARSNEPEPPVTNERLRDLMTQRYEILQRLVQDSERQLEAGRMDVPTVRTLTDAMYRAQADLGTTAAERVKVYEKLVEVLAAQEKLLERQVEAGRALGVQVAQGKLVTLHAQIDL
jgi:hypothetical protein